MSNNISGPSFGRGSVVAVKTKRPKPLTAREKRSRNLDILKIKQSGLNRAATEIRKKASQFEIAKRVLRALKFENGDPRLTAWGRFLGEQKEEISRREQEIYPKQQAVLKRLAKLGREVHIDDADLPKLVKQIDRRQERFDRWRGQFEATEKTSKQLNEEREKCARELEAELAKPIANFRRVDQLAETIQELEKPIRDGMKEMTLLTMAARKCSEQTAYTEPHLQRAGQEYQMKQLQILQEALRNRGLIR